jgi:alkanesulfonate monooxygenase SsuD/methylene tetrahydromethanopterin reductase-like flavin-dependent oxidoreductase (luciferase family)
VGESAAVRFSVFSVADHHPDEGRSIGALYGQLLDQIALADELGFDAYFVAEHHVHEYGIVPSPAALLGAATQRTGRIRLGVAVSVLTFHDPLLLAEEYAELDQLSGGRLVLGVGSGYLRHEFEAFGIGQDEKRDRFDEGLQVMLAAWRGERFSFHGRFHHVEDVRLAVTPLQRPHPPIWVAILRPEAAYHVGRQGLDVMTIPYATTDVADDLGALVRDHARGASEAGAAGPVQVAAALHTHVADSPERARAEAEPALDRYVRTRLYARQRSYDELDQAGLVLFGDPETIVARLRRLQALGLGHVMILPDFGGLAPELVASSMRRFAREVAPAFA